MRARWIIGGARLLACCGALALAGCASPGFSDFGTGDRACDLLCRLLQVLDPAPSDTRVAVQPPSVLHPAVRHRHRSARRGFAPPIQHAVLRLPAKPSVAPVPLQPTSAPMPAPPPPVSPDGIPGSVPVTPPWFSHAALSGAALYGSDPAATAPR